MNYRLPIFGGPLDGGFAYLADRPSDGDVHCADKHAYTFDHAKWRFNHSVIRTVAHTTGEGHTYIFRYTDRGRLTRYIGRLMVRGLGFGIQDAAKLYWKLNKTGV